MGAKSKYPERDVEYDRVKQLQAAAKEVKEIAIENIGGAVDNHSSRFPGYCCYPPHLRLTYCPTLFRFRYCTLTSCEFGRNGGAVNTNGGRSSVVVWLSLRCSHNLPPLHFLSRSGRVHLFKEMLGMPKESSLTNHPCNINILWLGLSSKGRIPSNTAQSCLSSQGLLPELSEHIHNRWNRFGRHSWQFKISWIFLFGRFNTQTPALICERDHF